MFAVDSESSRRRAVTNSRSLSAITHRRTMPFSKHAATEATKRKLASRRDSCKYERFIS